MGATLTASIALGQDAAPRLEAALVARYPAREIVPRSCPPPPAGETVIASQGRVCLVDGASGAVRAVRRVSLGGDVSVARAGGDVLFASGDSGGATSRYSGRVWRWDLTRDAYLGVALPGDDVFPVLAAASFGALYETRAGLQLHDGARAVRVSHPWGELGLSRVTLFVHAGATYSLEHTEGGTHVVSRVELAGTRLTSTPIATFSGEIVLHEGGVLVAIVQARARSFVAHVLALPRADVVDVALPSGVGRPRGAERIDATHVLLRPARGQGAVLDLESATITPTGTPPGPPATTIVLTASALVTVTAMRDGLYVRASGGRFLLSGGGVAPGEGPSRAPSACRCEGSAMACRDGARVEGACPDVQELEQITDDMGERVLATQFSPDGRFRVDRVEADYARVTRLADAERLWVRVFGGVLFAQSADGHFFATDRAIVDRLWVRDGRALLDAPMTPLAQRADALFDAELVSRFFRAP